MCVSDDTVATPGKSKRFVKDLTEEEMNDCLCLIKPAFTLYNN